MGRRKGVLFIPLPLLEAHWRQARAQVNELRVVGPPLGASLGGKAVHSSYLKCKLSPLAQADAYISLFVCISFRYLQIGPY